MCSRATYALWPASICLAVIRSITLVPRLLGFLSVDEENRIRTSTTRLDMRCGAVLCC
jgi:hypothetical protein